MFTLLVGCGYSRIEEITFANDYQSLYGVRILGALIPDPRTGH